MPLRKEISKAIDALLILQKEDGGIPATKSEDLSGSWTTADTLEAVLISGTFSKFGVSKIKGLVHYLVNKQLNGTDIQNSIPRAKNNLRHGGWSTYQGQEPGTMTTGHCVASLILAKKFFDDDNVLQDQISKSIDAGFQWIERNHNHDGGWGVLPNSGEDGKHSRVIAMHYALFPYFYSGQTISSSKVIRDAIEHLKKLQKPDGSWGIDKNRQGDVCNTARAISCLTRADSSLIKSKVVKKAIKFILSNQIPKHGLWDIEPEIFDIAKLPGSTVFNDNTNCDVLIAFMDAKYFSKDTHILLKWLLEKQDDSGLFYLCSPIKCVNQINTWSTAEWALCVDRASREFIGYQTKLFEKEKFNWNWVILPICFLVVLGNTCYTYWANISGAWNSLSDFWKDFILIGVITTFIITVVASFFFEWLKKKAKTTSEKFARWYDSKLKKQENQ
jgi:hypothetical protein